MNRLKPAQVEHCMKLLNFNRPIQRWISFLALFLGAVLFLLLWRNVVTIVPTVTTPQRIEIARTDEPIQAIPQQIKVDPSKVTLGEKLFQDVRLSTNNQKSCLSCHSFSLGGADGRSHSIGIDGALTEVNTPTIFNARFNYRFNWNGKFTDLSTHLDALMSNPKVMGVQWPEAIRSLQQVPEYARSFDRIYPDGVTPTNVKDALVAYELSLNTPNSRFDRFLMGDKQALNQAEQEGYRLFKANGCVSCHQGVNVGGNMFQPFGIIGDYLTDREARHQGGRGKLTPGDLGRFNVTQNAADRHVFRVPSLRNVAVTAPYFHDGSAQTLEEAVGKMTKYQLGRTLPTDQIQSIVQFLRTLTGEYRGKPL
jgi:cytochrome c peroxidase